MNARRFSGGQALPLSVGLAAVGALSLVLLYNFGQTAAARARLTHAADAAAYSGALVQARALNLLAFINRAQVAHQVAMAHLVTLASWAQFGQAEQRRLLQGNPPGPLIGMLFGPAHGKAYASAAEGMGSIGAINDLARAHARHNDVAHRVLTGAARAVLADVPASRLRAMQAVLHANYPELAPPKDEALTRASYDRLELHMLADQWPGFVQRHGSNTRGAMREMTLRSTDRYGFLAPRNGTARNAWPVSFRCPMRRHELRRRGGTRLQADGSWHAYDTQSFHKVRSNRYIGCYYREYAMGWGKVDVRGTGARANRDAGDADVRAPADFSHQDFWRWVRDNTRWDIVNGASNPLAYVYSVRGAVRWHGGGIPDYAEIPLRRARVGAGFSIRVREPATSLRTTDARSTVSGPIGRFGYAGLRRGEHVGVSSAAETYFSRPEPRADGSNELATLFRPYWQARLVPLQKARGSANANAD